MMTGAKKRRNAVLDLMKFVFAVMIVLYHSRDFLDNISLCTGGYIGVDFFFIVSGYYLASSAYKLHNNGVGITSDTFRYVARRISRIYPELIVAMLIALLVRSSIFELTRSETILLFVESYGEWSMLQQLGISDRTVLGATWYISAMMIVSCVLFPLGKALGRAFFLILAPSLFAFIFVFTYIQLDTIQVPNEKLYGVVHIGLIRGMMDMTLGVTVYGVRSELSEWRPNSTTRIISTVLEITLYLLIIIYYSFGEHYNHKDWLAILMLGAVVLITQTDSSYTGNVVRGGVFQFLGMLSYDLYLGHRFWSLLINDISWLESRSETTKVAAYLMLSMITALVIMCIVELVRKIVRFGQSSLRLNAEDSSIK